MPTVPRPSSQGLEFPASYAPISGAGSDQNSDFSTYWSENAYHFLELTKEFFQDIDNDPYLNASQSTYKQCLKAAAKAGALVFGIFDLVVSIIAQPVNFVVLGATYTLEKGIEYFSKRKVEDLTNEDGLVVDLTPKGPAAEETAKTQKNAAAEAEKAARQKLAGSGFSIQLSGSNQNGKTHHIPVFEHRFGKH